MRKRKLEFMENKKGIHLMEGCGGEVALCGDAWDNDELNDMMSKTPYTVVTCPSCVEVIQYVRRAHYRPQTQKDFRWI